MSVPTSTYRIQLSAAFTMFEAAELVPYLAALGVGAVYLSPLLRSTHGSVHGYDVVDHSMIDPDRGGELGLVTLAQACSEAGVSIVLDAVPNHMGVTEPVQNPAWWDVLRFGRQSAYASWFDVDWEVADGKILLPIVPDDVDVAAETVIEDDELHFRGMRLPVGPHGERHYELINYRRADTEQNYRRFFAVSGLAALRVEDPNVHEATHRELVRIMTQYDVAGIRIDHPDGLTDPGAYLQRLRASLPDAWILVEKITQPGEAVPTDWPIAGLTGYDALNEITAVLVDPAAEPLMTRAYRDLTGDTRNFADHEREAKHQAASTILRAEVARIARLVPEITEAPAVLTELATAFSVYRSYLPEGRQYLDEAVTVVREARPEMNEPLDALLPRLLDPADEVCRRFQQLSGAVMAKGVEDAAFYRYTRFIAFNEVGGNPGRFGSTIEEFHEAQRRRLATAPLGMTTLSTHDTKRGEDIRARLAVLAELAQDSREVMAAAMASHPIADRTVSFILWQTAIAMAVATELDDTHRERLHAYLEKAMREAGVSTNWPDPDAEFEASVHRAVDAVFDDPNVHALITELAASIEPHAWSNSLSQKLIQLTMPGVPDVYQGSEFWEDSLVDPDNRRPVDFATRVGALHRLDTAGTPPADAVLAKLWVTSRALRTRRDHPECFSSYEPVRPDGRGAEHLIAFDRGGAITLATRLPATLERLGGWLDTTLTLDCEYRDVLTDRTWDGVCKVADLLDTYPVALLVRT